MKSPPQVALLPPVALLADQLRWQWLKPIGLARMLQDPLQDISNYCRTKVAMLKAQPLAAAKTIRRSSESRAVCALIEIPVRSH
jgi:hypothetical protein